MKKFKKLIKSPHLQIALATGVSIIALAYFSKKILPEPIGFLPLAIPPFIASIYEAVATKHKNKKITTTWYWLTAIFVSTALVIVLNAI